MREAGSSPVAIVVLEVFIIHREAQNSGVMVEAKVVVGTLYPLNLLGSELWQSGEIKGQSKLTDLMSFQCSKFNVRPLIHSIPRFREISGEASLPDYGLHRVTVVSIENRMCKPANVKLKRRHRTAFGDFLHLYTVKSR